MNSTTEKAEITKRIEDLYSDASGSWSIADWTHERVIANYGPVLNDYGDPIYCDGQDDDGPCQTCTQVVADADAAEKLAEEAIDAFRLGNYDEAAELASEASSREITWGDNPTWGEFARTIEDCKGFRATHKLTGWGHTEDVMLQECSLYTLDEWACESGADWTLDDDGVQFQGQVIEFRLEKI